MTRCLFISTAPVKINNDFKPLLTVLGRYFHRKWFSPERWSCKTSSSGCRSASPKSSYSVPILVAQDCFGKEGAEMIPALHLSTPSWDQLLKRVLISSGGGQGNYSVVPRRTVPTLRPVKSNWPAQEVNTIGTYLPTHLNPTTWLPHLACHACYRRPIWCLYFQEFTFWITLGSYIFEFSTGSIM